MPELPVVEYARRLIEDRALGRTLATVRCAPDPIVLDGASPRRVERALTGQRVVAVRRRGKYLWLELDGPLHPLFHLGMSGTWRTPGDVPPVLSSSPKVVDRSWPPRFWKIQLELDDGGALAMTNARRLGRIRLREAPAEEPPISRLGFDPLTDMPGRAAFRERLARRPRAVLKLILLDQSFAAGVGNWIADEVLYQARLDPRRRVESLTPAEAERLRAAIARVVRVAVEAEAKRDRFPRGWLFHHRWGRDTAAKTARGERVEHLTIGGRTTAWVPTRQS